MLDAFGAAGFAGTGGVTFGVRRRRRGDLENLLVELTQLAIVLAPAPGPSAPNLGDQHLWDLLAARGDLALVTGDKLLLNSELRERIVTAQQFLSA